MTAMTLSPSGLSPTEKSKINSIGKNPAKITTADLPRLFSLSLSLRTLSYTVFFFFLSF